MVYYYNSDNTKLRYYSQQLAILSLYSEHADYEVSYRLRLLVLIALFSSNCLHLCKGILHRDIHPVLLYLAYRCGMGFYHSVTIAFVRFSACSHDYYDLTMTTPCYKQCMATIHQVAIHHDMLTKIIFLLWLLLFLTCTVLHMYPRSRISVIPRYFPISIDFNSCIILVRFLANSELMNEIPLLKLQKKQKKQKKQHNTLKLAI